MLHKCIVLIQSLLVVSQHATGLYKVHWQNERNEAEGSSARSEQENEVATLFTYVHRSTFSSKFGNVAQHVQHPQLNGRNGDQMSVNGGRREQTFVLHRVMSTGPKQLLVKMHRHETLSGINLPEKGGCRLSDSQFQGIVYDEDTDSFGSIAAHSCNGRLDGVLSLPKYMLKVSGTASAVVLDPIEESDQEFKDQIVEVQESKRVMQTTSTVVTSVVYPIHIVHDSYREKVYQDEYAMAQHAMQAANVADMQYNRAALNPRVRIVVKGMTVQRVEPQTSPGVQSTVIQTELPKLSTGVPTISSPEDYLKRGLIAWAANSTVSGVEKNVVPVMLTGLPQAGIAGIATLGTACSTGAGVQVQSLYNSSPSIVGQVLAHELGHVAGLPHDEDIVNVSASDGRIVNCPSPSPYLMSSITDRTSVAWSTCSREQWTYSSGTVMRCFTDNEDNAFSLGTCGNGIVEPGEQCDCKLEDCSDDPCCDKAKCRLKTGAHCSTTQPCCSACKVATQTQVCRFNHHSLCDVPEVCDGYSAECPENQSRNQGFWCSGDFNARDGGIIGRCYDGQCRSAASICWSLGKAVCEDKEHDCSHIYCKDRPAMAGTFRTMATTTSSECVNVVKTARISDGLSCPNNGQCLNGDCVYTLLADSEPESAGIFDMGKGWSIVVITVLGSLIFASAGVMLYAFLPTHMFEMKPQHVEDEGPVLPVRVSAANAMHLSRLQNGRSLNPNSRR